MSFEVIDNTTEDDNWIYNATNLNVSVACKEAFGSFVVNLKAREKKRITYNVQANVYPLGQYSYNNLIYNIGKREKWEVELKNSKLILNCHLKASKSEVIKKVEQTDVKKLHELFKENSAEEDLRSKIAAKEVEIVKIVGKISLGILEHPPDFNLIMKIILRVEKGIKVHFIAASKEIKEINPNRFKIDPSKHFLLLTPGHHLGIVEKSISKSARDEAGKILKSEHGIDYKPQIIIEGGQLYVKVIVFNTKSEKEYKTLAESAIKIMKRSRVVRIENKPKFTINITGKGDLNLTTKLNLEDLCHHFKTITTISEIKYEPKKFPGLVFSLQCLGGRPRFLLFSTGKFVIVKPWSSHGQAMVKKACNDLQKLVFEAKTTLERMEVERETQEDNITKLIEVLKSGDVNARKSAVRLLEENRSAYGLVIALGNDNKDVVSYAYDSLTRLEKAVVVEPVITGLQNSDNVTCRRLCAVILGYLSPPSRLIVDSLARVLTDDDATLRANAAVSLGLQCDPIAVEPLIKVLGDKEGVVRKSAAFALGCIEDKRAMEPLKGLLEDEDSEVRNEAKDALRRL